MKSLKISICSKIATLAAGLLALGSGVADAAITYDLRAVGATGAATVVNPKTVSVAPGGLVGSTVSFELFAVAAGTNVTDDEGFQSGLMQIRTFAAGTKNIKGDFTAKALGAGFSDSGSNSGSFADVNGDGDLDVGGTASSNAAGYFTPRAAAIALGTGPGGTSSFMIGTFTLTLTSVVDLNSVVNTLVNVSWPSLNTILNSQRSSWRADNVSRNGGTAAPYNTIAGADVQIQLVPEPSAFGMLLVGALGLVGFRRIGFRRSA